MLHFVMSSCYVCCMFTELYEYVIAANRTENSERRMLKLKKLLHELPEHNFETFRFLAQHLNKVATREEQNKVHTCVVRAHLLIVLLYLILGFKLQIISLQLEVKNFTISTLDVLNFHQFFFLFGCTWNLS